MGLTTTVERAHIAALYAVRSVRRPGGLAGETEWAWGEAIRRVTEALQAAFDVGDHVDQPTADLETAARKFCFDVCPAGEEAQPGKHMRCGVCPLKRFTLDPVAGGIEKAIEAE